MYLTCPLGIQFEHGSIYTYISYSNISKNDGIDFLYTSSSNPQQYIKQTTTDIAGRYNLYM